MTRRQIANRVAWLGRIFAKLCFGLNETDAALLRKAFWQAYKMQQGELRAKAKKREMFKDLEDDGWLKNMTFDTEQHNAERDKLANEISDAMRDDDSDDMSKLFPG